MAGAQEVRSIAVQIARKEKRVTRCVLRVACCELRAGVWFDGMGMILPYKKLQFLPHVIAGDFKPNLFIKFFRGSVVVEYV